MSISITTKSKTEDHILDDIMTKDVQIESNKDKRSLYYKQKSSSL